MAFLFRSAVAARSAAAAVAARPVVASVARFPAMTSLTALRFSSSKPDLSQVGSTFSSPQTDAPQASSSSGLPAARRQVFDLSSVSHLIPSKAHEEDPDAWWRATDATVDRNFGKPGNPYTGRSVVVRGNSFPAAARRLSMIITQCSVRPEYRRAMYYERPSERKVRLRSQRWRRRFADQVRQRVQMVQALRARK